jgi:GxxExxY protein
MQAAVHRGDAEAQRINAITEKIIGCAIEVHRALGPGLLESAYEECTSYEILCSGLQIERQVSLPVVYKGVKLDCGYRMDLVVEKAVIVEFKTVEVLLPVHEAQLLSYLKLTGLSVGLLINFHVPVLKDGLKRIVNAF